MLGDEDYADVPGHLLVYHGQTPGAGIDHLPLIGLKSSQCRQRVLHVFLPLG